jgi:hypothetical protein
MFYSKGLNVQQDKNCLELPLHLKLISVNRDKVKSFMDFDITPNEPVFRAIARSGIVSHISIPIS